MSLLTAGEKIHIEKFALHRSTFVRNCYLIFRELLREITSGLEQSDFKILTARRSPTIRYPPATPLVRPFDKFPSFILPIQKRDFNSNKNTWFLNKRVCFEFEQSLRSVKDDDWLVLKVCAKLLSGGWSHLNQLKNFLRMCNELKDTSSLKKLIVEKLYLGVYTNSTPVCFALTRYLPMKCSSVDFFLWWSANRTNSLIAFVDQVLAVALEAIENDYYHWDIRPANLLFEKKENRFYILDWDSLLQVGEGEFTEPAKLLDGKISLLPYTLKTELTLCERLLFGCVFKWDGISPDSQKKAEDLCFSKRKLKQRKKKTFSNAHFLLRF